MMQRDADRKEFFNERAGQWMDMWYKDTETGAYTRHEQAFQRLFSMLNLQPGDAVLDLGCGSGVLVPYILKEIGEAGTLVEVDYAEKMMEENQRLHDDPRITFVACSVYELEDLNERFSKVICFSCFPHFEHKADALKKIEATLQPSGRLYIAHFDSSEDLNAHHRKHECVMHDHLPSEAAMRALIHGANLQIEQFLDETGFYFVAARKGNGE